MKPKPEKNCDTPDELLSEIHSPKKEFDPEVNGIIKIVETTSLPTEYFRKYVSIRESDLEGLFKYIKMLKKEIAKLKKLKGLFF